MSPTPLRKLRRSAINLSRYSCSLFTNNLRFRFVLVRKTSTNQRGQDRSATGGYNFQVPGALRTAWGERSKGIPFTASTTQSGEWIGVQGGIFSIACCGRRQGGSPRKYRRPGVSSLTRSIPIMIRQTAGAGTPSNESCGPSRLKNTSSLDLSCGLRARRSEGLRGARRAPTETPRSRRRPRR